jgi:cardiolipin hydrolase
MRPEELIEHLRLTLDDARLSRSERRGLRAALEAAPLDQRAMLQVRAGLFDAAREALHDPRDRAVLRWLEDCLGALRVDNPRGEAPEPENHAWFGPADPLAATLAAQLAAARGSIDAAVFTITDDRIAAALLDAHERGVALRIVSDGEKAHDPGSDIRRMMRAGIPIRTRDGEGWMHHKFAVVDRRTLITGSYNWTRAGSGTNHENFLTTSEPQLVGAYLQAFEKLWDELGPRG